MDKELKKFLDEALVKLAEKNPSAKALLYTQRISKLNHLIMDELMFKRDESIASKFANFYEQQEEIIKDLAREFFGEEILKKLEE